MWVINTGTNQLTVPIALSDDASVKIDSIFIQGKSKARLPEGYVVETEFLAQSQQLKVVSEKKVPVVTPPLDGSSKAKPEPVKTWDDKKVLKKDNSHPNV